MLLIKKIQNIFILFREDRSEQNKKVKIKDCLFQCSAQGAQYSSNFLKRSKAVLIFLDPSPERKPSVMKPSGKDTFEVSDFLLSFWIPFQERLNWFCSSGLLCSSPFHLWVKNLVQMQNSIAWPDFSAQSCLKQKHQDYSSLYNGMVYSKKWSWFSSIQFFSQSEGSRE